MVATPKSNDLLARVRQLEMRLNNVTNKAPNTLLTGGGIGPIIGPSGFVDAFGNQINSITILDPTTGQAILSQHPTTIIVNPDGTRQGLNWEWALTDAAGNPLIGTDGVAQVGLATPYLAIPLVKRWAPPLQTATAANMATAVASSVIGMGALWAGSIGYCSHPCISVYGTWGDLDNAAHTIKYQLKVGVLTFTWTATSQVEALHQFDISTLAAQRDVDVTLSVIDVGGAAGTDRIIVDQLSCYLRETPNGGSFG